MYMKKTIAIAAGALLLTGCEKDRQAEMQRGPGYPGPSEAVQLNWKAGNQWKVKLKDQPEQDPDKAKTKLPKGAGPTMFVVRINGNQTATFKNPGGLSVWEGGGPNAKSSPQPGINSDQIIGPIVTKDGRKLVFFDLNKGNPVTLNYELHFNNGLPSVDPIIENNP